MWAWGNRGSCASNADHSTHRCVPCDENQSESRMPEIGTSGSMSGDGKRGVAEWPKLPRPSSTLPSLPIAALQFFGRYWGHSGHRDALEPEGSVAIDPGCVKTLRGIWASS